MSRRSLSIAALAASAMLAPTATAFAAPHTTVSRTIQDCDGDNLLEFAPGEEHLEFRFGEPPPSEPPSDEACPRDEGGDTPRRPRTDSLLHFLHLSDFQIVDEESPARVEFFDFTQRPSGPFASAYRPQESLTTQVTEAMVRTARNATSPVTGATLDFSILTGDNADSQQYNEIRWFIDILDGTTGDGGANPDPEMSSEDGTSTSDRKIVPDSGIAEQIPACSVPQPPAGFPGIPAYQDNGSIYDGVRDRGRPGQDAGYYEPDSSELRADGSGDDGDGYSPSRSRNGADTPGQDVTVRDFPGLLEDAQAPYEAVGLGMPWYSGFGNHDAQVQGNSGGAYFGPGLIATPPWQNATPFLETSNPIYQSIATGCVKPTQLPPGLPLTPQALQAFFVEFSQDPGGFIARCLQRPPDERSICDTAPIIVPPDPRRCFVAKAEPAVADPDPCSTGGFVEQHFRTTGTPHGHGFAPALAPDEEQQERTPEQLLAAARACADDEGGAACPSDVREARTGEGRPPEAVANHDGYYAFIPRAGFRLLMLDSVTDECPIEPFCSEGSFDHDQFRWVRDQLVAAATAGQFVMAFSHHTLRTSRLDSRDSTEWAPNSTQPHFGERFDRQEQPPEPIRPEAQNQTLEELFCQHPNLIAFINGHEHENFVEPHTCGGPSPSPGEFPGPVPPGPGEFVEVSTAAHIDWPQQSRLIELVEVDGEMSLVLTIVDHDGPPNPGGPHPCADDEPPESPDPGCEAEGPMGQAGEEPVDLASMGREIGYNDYQHGRGARGDRSDRNVIVPLGRPAPE
ncbi:MAG TPA: hypothetical protein VHG69_01295 [Thermoleophilaceae bacterium]|nr:hypothetical protein [Thermoleophilaceae bacterium]